MEVREEGREGRREGKRKEGEKGEREEGREVGDQEPIRMQGRVLLPETIYYKYDPNSANWSREMRGKTLLSNVGLMKGGRKGIRK